jgi:oxygen-independent coproporphyrinogen III oxidase
MNSLINKYNVAGPRYTSYPTVPFWDNSTFNEKEWIDSIQTTFELTNGDSGISLYIHLPYCESLCTFCGCYKRVTKNHAVEKPYILAILKEWELYLSFFSVKPTISEIHLGGGTPSFFSPEILELLINGIVKCSKVSLIHEFGFEGHPNNTTREHLQSLYDYGFRRVSFGVQDYDPIVQKAINRVQPFENVKQVTDWSREIGYQSVSHDLVYGLPFQKLDSIEETINKTIELQPDRLAFYSYAHVPWLKGNGQRGFKDENLPTASEKRALYELGKRMLNKNNYYEIGMDHFALKTDSLYKAMQNRTLNRNFMGYTTTQTKLILGLGASAISDSWTGFAQNIKDIDYYINCLKNSELPIMKGHILDSEDLIMRQHILNIICKFTTTWQGTDFNFEEKMELMKKLEDFEKDGLIEFDDHSLRVKKEGQPFVRNICMAFDKRMLTQKQEKNLFSQTI